ncbi:PD-(D/E)XK nuclease family protein [archaeon]|nr:PD-(D/E)XK nuclease family protein [Candidatus Woesearchaeota archaeon]MBT4135683.1 PD-(D/E)XK nuclease family protein [archaeon]MBT4242044.1 PD-(D/E)XK nuclease family protein [archaeon]MBT4417732.1 PD-(D/E)XK nuclease family protein [archaeon]
MVLYSHSRLSSFEQCPFKYKCRYIDKLKPDIKTTIEGFLGNAVHSTLEWVYTHSKERTFELDDLIEYYAKLWRGDYSPEIKIVKEEFNEEFYFNKGIKFLIDYFMKYSPFKDNTIETEKKLIMSLDLDGKYKIIGFIDRLIHHQDTNIFEVHDYKTSATLKSQEELDQDRQLALYAIGIRKLYPQVNDVKLVWHYLDFNKTVSSERTVEQLETLRQEIMQLIDKVESATEFPPLSSILCKWCEFRSYCPTLKEESNNPEENSNSLDQNQSTSETNNNQNNFPKNNSPYKSQQKLF